MNYTKPFAIALLLASWTFEAHAGFISGNHILQNGNNVALQGLEWMPLTYTSNISRFNIESGFTDHFNNNWKVGDWRYATRGETEKLINSLWGGEYNGWSANNADGAWWFLNNFGGLAYDEGVCELRKNNVQNEFPRTGFDYSYFSFGATSECSQFASYGCVGLVQGLANSVYDMFAQNKPYSVPVVSYYQNSGNAGYFDDQHGGDFQHNQNNQSFPTDFSSPWHGNLLVRQQIIPEVVPLPSSLSFFAIASLGMLILRRRKQV